MKTVILSVAIILTVLFIGCGGGGASSSATDGGSSQSSSASIPSSNVQPIYDYAEDTTALRTLNNEAVNSYKEVQQQLKSITDETKPS